MNDDILVVSGGGSTAVSTDDLFAERAALDALRHQATGWGVELGRIQSLASGAAAVPAPAWTSTGPDYALFAAASPWGFFAATGTSSTCSWRTNVVCWVFLRTAGTAFATRFSPAFNGATGTVLI